MNLARIVCLQLCRALLWHNTPATRRRDSARMPYCIDTGHKGRLMPGVSETCNPCTLGQSWLGGMHGNHVAGRAYAPLLVMHDGRC